MTYYFDCSVLFFCCFFCLFCIFFILFFVFFFFFFFFFFQAEDGIRDRTETGVQTCALPISADGTTVRVSVDSAGVQVSGDSRTAAISADGRFVVFESDATNLVAGDSNGTTDIFVHDRDVRSEERRVGKECRCGWWAYQGERQ